MNLRNVLRAYSLLRQLSDDETALLNILRALNDNDREQLVASMSDKPQKKSSKKAAGGGGKSASKSKRGKSIETQLSQRRTDNNLCTHIFDNNEVCLEREDSPLHTEDTDYVNAHAFKPSQYIVNDATSAAGSGG